MADDSDWQDYTPPSQESDQPSQISDDWQDQEPATAQAAPPEDDWKDQEPEDQGAVTSLLRGAAHSILPGVAGLVGAGAGGAVGNLPGAIAGGLAASAGASALQEKAVRYFWPEEAKKLEEAEAQHPLATGVGEVAGFLPSVGVKGASTLVRAAMAGIGGGTDYALSGDPWHAAGVGAASGLLGKPTALGESALALGERGGQKFSTLMGRKVADAQAAQGAAPSVDPATGAAPGGAAHVEPQMGAAGDALDVQTGARKGPGPTAAKGVAEENASPKDVIPSSESESQATRGAPVDSKDPLALSEERTRGPIEAGKDKVQRQGTIEPKAAGDIPQELRDAMESHTAEEAPTQLQQQGGSPYGPPGTEPPGARPPSTLTREGQAIADINKATAAAMPKGTTPETLGRQALQGQEAAGAGGAGAPPPGTPPPNKAAPGGKGPAAAVPPPRYAAAEKTTPEKAGEALNRGFDNLNRMQNADFYDYMGRLKKATQSAATLLGKGGEDIYHAIEQGKYKDLPEQLRNRWENFSNDIKKEIKGLEKELAKRGRVPPESDDPNYINRVRKMPMSWRDWINNDPVSALQGMIRPDMMKSLEYRGAEAPDGSRIVLQDMSPEKYAVWKDGEQHVYQAPQREEGAKGFKNGDKIEYNGKQYTVDRGRTNEIEKHVVDKNGKPIQYKKNAALSLYEHRAQLKAAIAYDDMIRTFKSDKALDPYRMRASSPEGQAAIKSQGFEELHGAPFKDFEGIAMHPDLAQAIRNNFEPGLGMRNNPLVNMARSFNQFAVRSIFWNPVPHSMNALLHYVVARGEDWLPVEFQKDSYMPKGLSLANYKRLGDSWKQAYQVVKAYRDVGTNSELMRDINQSGMPLVQSSRQRNDAHQFIGDMLGVSLKNEPRLWAGWAQKFGLGKATDAIKAVYDGSSNALWGFSDALMHARIHELEAKGLTREEAIANASIHMPDYVLPNKLFGIRGAPSMMADPSVFMFGRYHAKVLDSLGHMTMDALGPNSTVEQRRQAFGNIMAVGVLATVVYPALDAAVQAVTGNKDAEQRRRGPLAPLTNIKEAVAPSEGKPPRTYASAISNLLTISPMVRAVKEALLDNRDWRGKTIVEPASPFYKQAAQLGEYMTKTAVSPYGTAEAATGEKGPGPVSSLAQQVTDTKVPTEEQAAGQFKAAKSLQKQAQRREKKPQGWLEQMFPLSGGSQ